MITWRKNEWVRNFSQLARERIPFVPTTSISFPWFSCLHRGFHFGMEQKEKEEEEEKKKKTKFLARSSCSLTLFHLTKNKWLFKVKGNLVEQNHPLFLISLSWLETTIGTRYQKCSFRVFLPSKSLSLSSGPPSEWNIENSKANTLVSLFPPSSMSISGGEISFGSLSLLGGSALGTSRVKGSGLRSTMCSTTTSGYWPRQKLPSSKELGVIVPSFHTTLFQLRPSPSQKIPVYSIGKHENGYRATSMWNHEHWFYIISLFIGGELNVD